MLSVKHIATTIAKGASSTTILAVCYGIFLLLLLALEWEGPFFLAVVVGYAILMPAGMIIDWIAWFKNRRRGKPNA